MKLKGIYSSFFPQLQNSKSLCMNLVIFKCLSFGNRNSKSILLWLVISSLDILSLMQTSQRGRGKIEKGMGESIELTPKREGERQR